MVNLNLFFVPSMSMQLEAMIQREVGFSLFVVPYCSRLDYMVCTLTSIVDEQL